MQARAITYCIAEMILQPFSVVGFKHLLAELEPRYVLPSHRNFSDVLIPEIFTKDKHSVSVLLSSASYVAFPLIYGQIAIALTHFLA